MPLPHQVRIITHQIHQVHIADGFADDCEELIHRWLKTEMLTFETFCVIWKDMQFDLIFHGRPTGAEMAELSEEVIDIAKHYMVTNPDNFEESVAGLFLVYSLLKLQPYAGFAALRIVPEDVPAILRIETVNNVTVARSSRRYDVLFILGSILTQGPVQYHAVATDRGMESSFRKYLDGTTGIDRVGVRPKGVFYRQNEELDLLRELNNITRRYQDAKRNIPGSNKSLNYTNDKLATELDSSLKGIINGILEEGDEGNKKISDHYSKVQAIKEKAMRQTVDSVKFLASAAERAGDPKKTLETEQSTSEKKQLSSKPETAKKQTSAKKRRRCTVKANTYRYRKRNRRKRTKYSSSSSNSCDSMELSTDDTQDEDDYDDDDSQDSQGVSDEDIEIRTHLDLDELDKKTQNKKTKQIEEKEIDISIDRLPVLIRTERDGNLYEIEIIDEMSKNSKPPEKITKTNLKQLEDVSLEKINQHGEGTSNDDFSDMAQIEKIDDNETVTEEQKTNIKTKDEPDMESSDHSRRPRRARPKIIK